MGFRDEAVAFVKSFLGNSNNLSYIGNIPLEVISEKSRSLSVSIPTKRVESGFNISDTVRKDPMLFNITVVDNSLDYLFNRQALEQLQETGEPTEFKFSGRDNYENIIIESIEEVESGQQKNGFTYYVTLRQIQVAEIKETDVQMDSKSAKSTGGKKKVTTAKISTPTKAESEKVTSSGKVTSKGKSTAKIISGNLQG